MKENNVEVVIFGVMQEIEEPTVYVCSKFRLRFAQWVPGLFFCRDTYISHTNVNVWFAFAYRDLVSHLFYGNTAFTEEAKMVIDIARVWDLK